VKRSCSLQLPRDLSGRLLGKKLGRVGYRFTRQVGSHMRFTRDESPQHSITIADHKELRLGTLRQILADVAGRLEISVELLTALREAGFARITQS